MYYVYIVTNKPKGTLYIGVTSNVIKRAFEHRSKEIKGFTQRYNLEHLIYVETYTDIQEAIKREKQLKNWHRDWKINLIEQYNPEWRDLYQTFL